MSDVGDGHSLPSYLAKKVAGEIENITELKTVLLISSIVSNIEVYKPGEMSSRCPLITALAHHNRF